MARYVVCRQFTLRMLLSAISVLCVGLACRSMWQQHARQVAAEQRSAEAEAIRLIVQEGGEITFTNGVVVPLPVQGQDQHGNISKVFNQTASVESVRIGYGRRADSGITLWESDSTPRATRRPSELSGRTLRSVGALLQLKRLDVGRQIEVGADWKWLSGLTALRSATLSGSSVKDDTITLLRNAKHLQELMLDATSVTGSGLRHLRHQTELHDLAIKGSHLAGLRELARLRSLRSLSLTYMRLGDTDFAPIAALRDIEKVSLVGTSVGDSCLAPLCQLRKLKHLSLHGTRITDAGVRQLAALPLRVLDLSKTSVTSRGIKHLVNCTTLKDLDLSETLVDDSAVPHLARMRGIKLLRLGATDMTATGAADLQRRLPHCDVLAPQ